VGKGSRKKTTLKLSFRSDCPKLTLTKLEIVQRQIETCSDLYFAFGDPVSIHVLINAAHEILDAHDRKVCKTGMLFDHPEKLLPEGIWAEFREFLKKPYVGFKHGSKDLNETVELPAMLTEVLLISAIEKFAEINQRLTAKMLLLRNWLLVHERVLTPDGEREFDAKSIRERYPPYARKLFQEECLPAYQRAVHEDFLISRFLKMQDEKSRKTKLRNS
jgi:hypothetical protein